MDLNQLNQWLKAYWEGELSEEEEANFKKQLLLNKDQLSGELKELANWLETAPSFKDAVVLKDDFDEDILSKIKKDEASDSWSWWKVAAAILVLVTLAYTAIVLPQNKENASIETTAMGENTQESPEKALEETKATLALMASMMDSGKDQLKSLALFKVAQEKIKKQSDKKVNSKKENS